MAKLKLLENLDLTCNNLCEIPNEICELKALKTLKLGHNKLMALPDDMYYLTDLRTVQIDHNLFNNKPPQYDLMKGVVSFNMSSNPMNDHRSKVRERLLVTSWKCVVLTRRFARRSMSTGTPSSGWLPTSRASSS